MSSILFTYLWQANLYLVLFYALYALLLQRETFFQWNRVYLMAALLAALCIPLLPTPEFAQESVVIQEVSNYNPFPERNLTQVIPNPRQAINPELINEVKPLDNFMTYVWLVYSLLVGFILVRLFCSLTYLMYLFFKYPRTKHKGYWIVHTTKQASFSFLNILFLGELSHLTPENQSKIVLHELVHIKQGHSLDILGISMLTSVFWFNPVVWLYLRSLRKLHEYLADAQVLKSGIKTQEYMQLLIKEMMGHHKLYVTLPFAKPSTLRSRYLMMQRMEKTPQNNHKLRLVFSVPLFTMILLFQWACNRQNFEEVNYLSTTQQSLPEGYKLLNTFFIKKTDVLQEKEHTLILADNNQYLLRVSPLEFRGEVILLDKNYKNLQIIKFPEHSGNFFHNEVYFQVSTAEAYNLRVIPEKPLDKPLQIDIAYLVDKEWEAFKAQREENKKKSPHQLINVRPVVKMIEADFSFVTRLNEKSKYHFSLFDKSSTKDASYRVWVSIENAQKEQVHRFELSDTQSYIKDICFADVGEYTFKVKTTHVSPELELLIYEYIEL